MSTRSQGQASVAAVAARLQELEEKLQRQEEKLSQQQDTIAGQEETNRKLRSERLTLADNETSGGDSSAHIKAPAIPYFSGDVKSCTFTKVKSFLYNVKKSAVFSKMSEERTVALAECYFTDIAASWMMRLEEEGRKPQTMAELQAAMIKEFVPPDEKARAKIELMNFKMKGDPWICILRSF